MNDAEHVAYLGAFVVQNVLWRGDLFQSDDGQYVAEHCVTSPDGSWLSAFQRITPTDRDDAVMAALGRAFAYFEDEGMDPTSMVVIHQSPLPLRVTH